MSNKKLVCFTDSFNGGGAQKQMVMLANGLSSKMRVKTLQYHNLNFIADQLNTDITQVKIQGSNKVIKIIGILKFLYKENPDCIISFLTGPNNYASLYKLMFFWRKTKLIVGERNYTVGKITLLELLKRFSHLIADKIVCNSQAQLDKLKEYYGNKLIFIPNGTEATGIKIKQYSKKQVYNLIVPARFIDQKNPLGLLKALKNIDNVNIFWYGELFKQYPIYEECKQYIGDNNLENRFLFKSPTTDIYNTLIQYDALILPSFYEGCPNAIIDAMYCGLPVLASNVSDNMVYLNHQKELVFDPHSIDDIAKKINYFKTLSSNELLKIGNTNISKAHYFFNINKMVTQYNNLI